MYNRAFNIFLNDKKIIYHNCVDVILSKITEQDKLNIVVLIITRILIKQFLLSFILKVNNCAMQKVYFPKNDRHLKGLLQIFQMCSEELRKIESL